MARRKQTPPPRRTPGTDDSLLIRSAESLGRMIGSLQRQLDDASKKLGTGVETLTDKLNNAARPPRRGGKKSAAKASSRKTTGTRAANTQRASSPRAATRPAKKKATSPRAANRTRTATTHK